MLLLLLARSGSAQPETPACSACLETTALCQVPQFLPWLHRVPLKFNLHSPAGDIKLWQHHADCAPESSDMLLYLAGVNEHAACASLVGKRWSVAHFLMTIQYLFEYGVRFLATGCYCTSREGPRRRKERNHFLFADHPSSSRSTRADCDLM